MAAQVTARSQHLSEQVNNPSEDQSPSYKHIFPTTSPIFYDIIYVKQSEERGPGHDGLTTWKIPDSWQHTSPPCRCFHCSPREKLRESVFLKLMRCVKKARLKMNTLQLLTESSRLAAPNISFYIWACHAWVIASCLQSHSHNAAHSQKDPCCSSCPSPTCVLTAYIKHLTCDKSHDLTTDPELSRIISKLWARTVN